MAKTSNIIYEGGAAPDHRRPSRPDAPAADSADRPQPAAPASSASVMTDSNVGDSYDDSDRPAASNRPQSSEGQDGEHLPQQHELRADEGPASAKSGMEGRGIRRTGAMGGAAGGRPESADGKPEATGSKHGRKQQQQQSPRSGSTNGAAGSDTSPHKHIGQLFFCH